MKRKKAVRFGNSLVKHSNQMSMVENVLEMSNDMICESIVRLSSTWLCLC